METGPVRAEKNWNLRALCEQETEERLVCPLISTRTNYGLGYKSLPDNLQQFHKIGKVPIQVPFSSLDEGNGIIDTMRSDEVKWHKTCINKCSPLKLQRAEKRKLDDTSVESSEAPSPVKTCTSLGLPRREVEKGI